MAEIQTNHTKEQKVFGARKRLSTKVDLTPMVDLGFLLITFFIFTTTLANPTAMKLVMPDDKPVSEPMEISEDRMITLLLSKNDHLFYYSGRFNGTMLETTYHGLRDVFVNKKRFLSARHLSPKITCLIKVTDQARYKNIVDCLDEMLINDVATYMLLDADKAELNALNN